MRQLLPEELPSPPPPPKAYLALVLQAVGGVIATSVRGARQGPSGARRPLLLSTGSAHAGRGPQRPRRRHGEGLTRRRAHLGEREQTELGRTGPTFLARSAAGGVPPASLLLKPPTHGQGTFWVLTHQPSPHHILLPGPPYRPRDKLPPRPPPPEDALEVANLHLILEAHLPGRGPGF